MRILAISGSLRTASTSTTLIRVAEKLAPEQIEFTLYDRLADLPHFSPDLDGGVPNPAVAQLREQLQAADGVLICTPEYAFGVPGSLKNALDWTVSSGDFSGKPVAVVSSSSLWGGGDKAQASLLLTLSALGAKVPEEGKLAIPNANKKLNASGELSDAETIQALKLVLDALAQAVNAYP